MTIDFTLYLLTAILIFALILYKFVKNIRSGTTENLLSIAFILVSMVSLLPIIMILIWNIQSIMIDRTGEDLQLKSSMISSQAGIDIAREIEQLRATIPDESLIEWIANTSEAELTGLNDNDRSVRLLEQEKLWYKNDADILRKIEQGTLSTLFNKYIRNHSAIKQILLTDRYGGLISYAGEKPTAFNYSVNRIWQESVAKRYDATAVPGSILITPGRTGSTVDILMPIFIPHTQAFRGILRTRIFIHKLPTLINQTSDYRYGHIDLVTQTGVIAYSSDISRIGNRYNQSASVGIKGKGNWEIAKSNDGEDIIKSQVPVQFPSNLKYLSNSRLRVSVSQNMGEALSTVRILSNTVMIAGVIIFILSSFVGRIIARKLTAPIQDLTKAVADLSENRYSKILTVSGPEEFRKFIISFNEMTKQLKSTMSALHTEIIERKTSAIKLDELQNLLGVIINSMPSILISVNADGQIVQWNDAAQTARGLTSTEATGKLLSEVFPELNFSNKQLIEAVNSNKTIVEEKIILKLHNEKSILNMIIYPLISKTVKGAVIRIDDVTELVKKEEQLRQSQKMETVGILAGGLAHDFNNVLAGIVGTLSLMSSDIKKDAVIPPDNLKNYLNILNESSERAKNIVQQLLALSRKQNLTLTTVDINTIIKDIVNICDNSFDKSIRIVPVYTATPALISADQNQIEQVLLNFCINASHAMTIMKKRGEKWGGTLTIGVEMVEIDSAFREIHPEAHAKNYWCLSVKDSGVGISKHNLSKIFSPFFTTKDKGKGTGLGLSVVYNIVHQHNGFIDVYSEEHLGTTFNAYFPIISDAVKSALKISSTDDIPTGEGLILVIDDEEIVNQTAVRILERCGYSTISASNGNEGLEQYAKYKDHVKLVLLDMVMPELSGLDTFFMLKEINPDVKILLSSGYREDDRVQELIKHGVDGFIQKPYTIKTLAVEISRLIT